MKRPAQPGEGEIPIGASEIPCPMAYTDPATGKRVIDVEPEVESEEPTEAPVKAPKARKRK